MLTSPGWVITPTIEFVRAAGEFPFWMGPACGKKSGETHAVSPSCDVHFRKSPIACASRSPF